MHASYSVPFLAGGLNNILETVSPTQGPHLLISLSFFLILTAGLSGGLQLWESHFTSDCATPLKFRLQLNLKKKKEEKPHHVSWKYFTIFNSCVHKFLSIYKLIFCSISPVTGQTFWYPSRQGILVYFRRFGKFLYLLLLLGFFQNLIVENNNMDFTHKL